MANIPDWVKDLYKEVDAKNVPGVLSFMHVRGGFGFGGQIMVAGHDDVGGFLEQFYSTIDGLKHSFDDATVNGDQTYVRGVVTYELGGETVSTGYVVCFLLDEGKILEFLIYVDSAPLGQLIAGHSGP